MANRISALFLFILLFISINCSQSTEPLKERNLIAESQRDPEFSSDGMSIVFYGLYDSVFAIHFVDISGNYEGYLIKNKGGLSSPSWSPDNKKYVFQ